MFYLAIATKETPTSISLNGLDTFTQQTVKRGLDPVVRRNDDFDLERAKNLTKEFINEHLTLNERDVTFLKSFKRGQYRPELLFKGEILEKLQKHPMALWKTARNKEKGIER